ncbi:MAG: hypothetical protein JWN60_2833 [Acidobacteria bacterium]|jgi:hypothetical protein|nr:hypothetical protein [Acidobacteriota bacterium]
MDSAAENKKETVDRNDFQIVEGEILEVSTGASVEDSIEVKTKISTRSQKRFENQKSKTAVQTIYLAVPFVFLTVTLLGGLRLSAQSNDFLFIKPALVCLIFAAITLVLFFRANLIRVKDWFSEEFSFTANAANALVLFTLFTASTQIFNALLPERGLPFWIVAFCFFWTLWNNLFADFDTIKLLKSLGALLGIAFVTKYLILANLTAPANDNWLKGLWENPARETFTYLLDLPTFSAGTGYIQFFTLALYLIGLFLIPQNIKTGSTQTTAVSSKPL